MGGLGGDGEVVGGDSHLRLQVGFFTQCVGGFEKEREGSGRGGVSQDFTGGPRDRGRKAFWQGSVRCGLERVWRNAARKDDLPVIRETGRASGSLRRIWREAERRGADLDRGISRNDDVIYIRHPDDDGEFSGGGGFAGEDSCEGLDAQAGRDFANHSPVIRGATAGGVESDCVILEIFCGELIGGWFGDRETVGSYGNLDWQGGGGFYRIRGFQGHGEISGLGGDAFDPCGGSAGGNRETLREGGSFGEFDRVGRHAAGKCEAPGEIHIHIAGRWIFGVGGDLDWHHGDGQRNHTKRLKAFRVAEA